MLFTAKNLKKYFFIESGLFEAKVQKIRALEDVSFTVEKNEVFGIVGESGCGKTTLARIVGRIIKPTYGTIKYDAQITKPTQDIQMIFQNPEEALNPKMPVGESLLEPLRCNGVKSNLKQRISQTLKMLSLPEDITGRFPHQLSGGQKQKIVIARAIALQPKLLICDEPTSALDLCMQAHILNLLLNLKKRFNLALLFITHDLNIIKNISDRIMVMYSGIIVEIGPARIISLAPSHPYSQLLMGSISNSNKNIQIVANNAQENQCKFFSCCPNKEKKCGHERPRLKEITPGHWVACFNIKNA